jgi:hypothetical protein
VKYASDSSWSSHRAYVAGSDRPNWLHVAEGLYLAGFAAAPDEFAQAVRSLEDQKSLEAPDRHERQLGRADTAARSHHERSSCDALLSTVQLVLGIEAHTLRRRHTRGKEALAKRVVIHGARASGLPLAEVARALGMSRQRTSYVASTPLTAEEKACLALVLRMLSVAGAPMFLVG